MKKSVIRLLFLVLLIVVPNYALELKNCDDEYKELWALHTNHLYNDANKRLEVCSFSDEFIIDSMNILKALLFYQEHKYQEALSVANHSKENIFDKFNKLGTDKDSDYNKKITTLYYLLLTNQANSYYMLGNYEEALKYYNIMISAEHQAKPYVYEFAAYSHNFLGEYSMSIERFKEAYTFYSNEYKKSQCAYNISATYSKKNKINDSIEWIDIAMEHYLEYARVEYIKKIYTDKDFKNLRNAKEFKEYSIIKSN